MKINKAVITEMQGLLNKWADSYEKSAIENYYRDCQLKAKKDPVTMFYSKFYPIYTQAVKNLNMYNDSSVNDSHVITAIKHCLKNNPKTNFIIK